MKYLDGFRDPDAARYLTARLAEAGARLDRPISLMEVCGSHTMAIARGGIRALLPPGVRLVSGPGCPVCVTDTGYIDAAVELAARDCILVTFGDMINVPGSDTSLAASRAAGARVEVVYSPKTTVDLAEAHPDRQVVFLAIGFETTAPPVLRIIEEARRRRLDNVSLLVAFKLVPPALDALIADPEVALDGLLCPPHVSAIIGSEVYRRFVEEQGIPCVVAGFESLDILYGLHELVDQLAGGRRELVNQYSRVVRPEGNLKAQELMRRYLEPTDVAWRGLGTLPLSGLRLRGEWASFDASRRFDVAIPHGKVNPACRCGDVLKGKLHPRECPLFARTCTPQRPFGACMVSSEGSCAAAFRYERRVA